MPSAKPQTACQASWRGSPFMLSTLPCWRGGLYSPVCYRTLRPRALSVCVCVCVCVCGATTVVPQHDVLHRAACCNVIILLGWSILIGPSSLTVFSTFISRNVGKAPYSRQIGSCLTEFLQVWSYLSPGIFDEKWKYKKRWVNEGGHILIHCSVFWHNARYSHVLSRNCWPSSRGLHIIITMSSSHNVIVYYYRTVVYMSSTSGHNRVLWPRIKIFDFSIFWYLTFCRDF